MDSALGAENPQQAEAYRVEQLGKLKNQILAAVTPAQSMPIPRVRILSLYHKWTLS
jgi:hypothetical protein